MEFAMSLFAPSGQLPDIVVPRDDFETLMKLAASGAASDGPADDLLNELERATIADDQNLPANIVRMGSTVSYVIDRGQTRTVRLVYPVDADISNGSISVLTPVGAALIGLRPGQTIGFETHDGSKREIRVIAVFIGASGSGPATPNAHAPSSTDDPGPSAA
jgi:regulator of nucleoside diphosphate kinase